MRIAIRAQQAEQMITEGYAGASKPLTKTSSVRSPHELRAWQSNPKAGRQGDTARKFAAVPFYLELAGHCPENLPDGSFPAVFDLADGQRRFPDKGLIKALLDQGLISGQMVGGELVFVLTPAGQNRFIGRQE